MIWSGLVSSDSAAMIWSGLVSSDSAAMMFYVHSWFAFHLCRARHAALISPRTQWRHPQHGTRTSKHGSHSVQSSPPSSPPASPPSPPQSPPPSSPLSSPPSSPWLRYVRCCQWNGVLRLRPICHTEETFCLLACCGCFSLSFCTQNVHTFTAYEITTWSGSENVHLQLGFENMTLLLLNCIRRLDLGLGKYLYHLGLHVRHVV